MYTIGQVSKMLNLPISTLRYYDKEGLFPNLERESGMRKFTDNEIEALRVIECLKKSGLEIKDIKQFMDWCKEGPSTYKDRLELILKQREKIEKEIQQLNKTLDMLQYKTWYYTEAIKDGNEKRVRELTPNSLPLEIKKVYESSHK